MAARTDRVGAVVRSTTSTSSLRCEITGMKVYRVFRVIDQELVQDWPDGSMPSAYSPGDVIGTITKLRAATEPSAPGWSLRIVLSEGPAPQRIVMPIEPFMTATEYEASFASPVLDRQRCRQAVRRVQVGLAHVAGRPTAPEHRRLGADHR